MGNRAKMYFKSCILLILFASDSLSISLDADNSQFDEIKKEIKQLEDNIIQTLEYKTRQEMALHGGSYNYFCPLGMQGGYIADSQITASSADRSTSWKPHKARLNGDTGWY